jgi:hypothetical protein
MSNLLRELESLPNNESQRTAKAYAESERLSALDAARAVARHAKAMAKEKKRSARNAREAARYAEEMAELELHSAQEAAKAAKEAEDMLKATIQSAKRSEREAAALRRQYALSEPRHTRKGRMQRARANVNALAGLMNATTLRNVSLNENDGYSSTNQREAKHNAAAANRITSYSRMESPRRPYGGATHRRRK